MRFILLPGHRFDTVGAAPLIKDIEFGGLIADKAFDSNWIIEDMNKRKAKIVISQHQRRAQPLDIDKDIYKWRHLIENFFGKLKEFKRIAMRSDKTDQSFEAMIYLATAVKDYEVVNWLENVGNAVHGDDYPAELNQRLLYRLHASGEGVQTPVLAVSLLSVRVLKGGEFGGNYAQPNASDFAPERAPKYYRDTDIEIVSQLSAASRGAYYSARPLSGELLQRIVTTGRAYWLDHKRQPLRWGNTREGRIEWRQASKRGVVPCLLVPGTIALNAEPPVYVDESVRDDRTGGAELAAEACPPAPVGTGDSAQPAHGSIASSWPTSAGTSSRPAAGSASDCCADRGAARPDIAPAAGPDESEFLLLP